MKIKNLCSYAAKSRIKAREAIDNAEYMFFTSSADENKRYKDYQFDKEAIIMGTGGNATLHYYNGKFSVSTDCLVLLPNSQVKCKYLYYFFKSHMNVLEAGFKGAGLKHTNKKYIEEIEINKVPDLIIQESIISRLDTMSENIEKLNRELELFDSLIKSRFIEMFGDPIANSKKLVTVSLKDILVLKAGDFTESSNIFEEQSDSHPYPCYGGNGIRGFVSEYNQVGEYSLIGRQGALSGNIQYATGKFKNTEHALLVTPLMQMNSIWLNQLLINLDLKRYQTGAAQPGISVKNLQEIQIIMVPITEQNRFANFVQQVDKSKYVDIECKIDI